MYRILIREEQIHFFLFAKICCQKWRKQAEKKSVTQRQPASTLTLSCMVLFLFLFITALFLRILRQHVRACMQAASPPLLLRQRIIDGFHCARRACALMQTSAYSFLCGSLLSASIRSLALFSAPTHSANPHALRRQSHRSAYNPTHPWRPAQSHSSPPVWQSASNTANPPA